MTKVFDIDTFYILTLLYLNVAVLEIRQSPFDTLPVFRVHTELERPEK